MSEEPGTNQDGTPNQPTAFEKWELPALLEQEELDEEAQLVEKLPTLEEIEKIRSDAYEEGFNLGKRQGVQDGLKEGEKQTQEKISELVRNFEKPLQLQDDRLEDVLLSMTINLARAIIRRELSIEPSAVKEIIKEVFEFVEKEEENFRILVNPQDVKGVGYFLEKEHPNEMNYQLVSDRQISQGGCVIQSDAYHVDAKLETQIETMLEDIYSKKDNAAVEILENQPLPQTDNIIPEASNTEDILRHGRLIENDDGGATVTVINAAEAKNVNKVDMSTMPFFDPDGDTDEDQVT